MRDTLYTWALDETVHYSSRDRITEIENIMISLCHEIQDAENNRWEITCGGAKISRMCIYTT
jgi:hypothetical protein